MKQPIYMLVGVPGVGKTYVTDRVGDAFECVCHDDFIGQSYTDGILEKWEKADKPLLIEAPFSVSQIKDPLEQAGAEVKVLILVEDPDTLAKRYKEDPNRDGKDLPKGHLTRQETYKKRADEYDAFVGNSDEVLEHLKQEALGSRVSKYLNT